MDIWIQETTAKDGPSHMPSWRNNLCPTALHITQALGGKSRVDGGGGGHGSLPKLGAKKASSEHLVVAIILYCSRLYIYIYCVIQNSISI